MNVMNINTATVNNDSNGHMFLVEELFRLSGEVISYVQNEYSVKGIVSWRELTFDAEHDLSLIFMVRSNGDRVACMDYGPFPEESSDDWAKWKTWEEVLTERNIWKLASENENYNHDRIKEIINLAQQLIFN